MTLAEVLRRSTVKPNSGLTLVERRQPSKLEPYADRPDAPPFGWFGRLKQGLGKSSAKLTTVASAISVSRSFRTKR